mmetsp:Transcript_4684/g.14849  ORF Transcript_4684/g.14849 Transcript_4684/m.14849 type:complete len:208 (-) Transcript_4684:621-1244(-)
MGPCRQRPPAPSRPTHARRTPRPAARLLARWRTPRPSHAASPPRRSPSRQGQSRRRSTTSKRLLRWSGGSAAPWRREATRPARAMDRGRRRPYAPCPRRLARPYLPHCQRWRPRPPSRARFAAAGCVRTPPPIHASQAPRLRCATTFAEWQLLPSADQLGLRGLPRTTWPCGERAPRCASSRRCAHARPPRRRRPLVGRQAHRSPPT